MDNFFTRMFQKREVSAPTGTITTTDPKTPENQGATQGSGSFEDRVVNVRSPQHALTISAVFRATSLIARTEAQFLIQYQRMNREGGNFVQNNRDKAGLLNYLMQVRPNDMMTASAFMQGLVINKLQKGNGIAYIEWDETGTWPRALWLCTNAQYNELTGTYVLQYYTRRGLQVRTNVPASAVIHIPNTFKYDNGWGMSTLHFAFDTLTLNKTELSQALDTAAKGGRVKGFIGEEKPAQGAGTLAFGMYSKESTNAYEKEVNRKVYSQDITALRGLEKFVNISMTAADQQMVELLGMTINDVCRFWGCQRPLLMEDTNSHYTTYQNARMEFLQWTVQPDILEMEQEFNSKLLGVEDFGKRRMHFCEQPIMRLDKEAQARVDLAMMQTGAASSNEIRQQYDRPAVEGGDKIFISANLKGLDEMSQATELKPGNYTVSNQVANGGEGAGEGNEA